MTKDRDMVLIEWYDAKFFPQTCSDVAIRDYRMATFRSLGYLVSRDDITTIIAAEYNDQDEYRDITLIPTGSVLSIHRLTPGSLV